MLNNMISLIYPLNSFSPFVCIFDPNKKLLQDMRPYLLLFSILIAYNASGQKQKLTSDYVDRFSTPVCYTIALKDTNQLWHGTGFLFKVKSKIYFFTNNHNVGDSFHIKEYNVKNKKSPPKDSLPNYLYIQFAAKSLGAISWVRFPLFSDRKEPLWINFYEDEKKTSRLLDVVAIPFPKEYYSYIETFNLLDSSSLKPDVALYPASELFVVGFPNDYGQISPYPIWKRGTIASEPKFNAVGISTFLIDATTRKGMSGSPVFFRSNLYTTYDGKFAFDSLFTFLIGIYRGQDYDAEIGEVIRFDKIYEKLNKLTN
jgi:hypothetical protein